MKYFTRLIYIIFILAHASCNESYTCQQESTLVIEGWIDSDDYPIVMVTTTIPVSTDKNQFASIEEHLLKWAKVTIDDGEKSVVLTGKMDTCYTPPYIFTTGKMKGIPGKTYKLTVSYEDYYAEAETTIPNPVKIDSFTVTPLTGDTLYELKAYFVDNELEDNHYKFFVNVKGKDKSYLPSYLGTINDEVLRGQSVVTIFQPSRLFYEEYTPFFSLTDTVSIKFSQIDTEAYQFWKAYDELQAFSGVLFFPYTSNLPSNIKGGIGYWFGYGSNKYHLFMDKLDENIH